MFIINFPAPKIDSNTGPQGLLFCSLASCLDLQSDSFFSGKISMSVNLNTNIANVHNVLSAVSFCNN